MKNWFIGVSEEMMLYWKQIEGARNTYLSCYIEYIYSFGLNESRLTSQLEQSSVPHDQNWSGAFAVGQGNKQIAFILELLQPICSDQSWYTSNPHPHPKTCPVQCL